MSEWFEDDAHAIAVIGLAGRFPGAADVDALWQLLAAGGEGIRSVDHDMLRAAGLDPALAQSPNYVASAAWVDDEDCFDAAFFGLTPREAAEMDPQHRLLLQCAYHALESAGYAPRSLTVPVGVYVGVKLPTYYLNNLHPHLHPLASLDDLKIQVAADKSYAATRIAHALNLAGPVLSVDTACSTSLVTVHLACRALLNEECDLALAGGANINVPQRVGYWHQPGGIQSPDGKCRAFDAAAAGTVFGNGVGLVALKRLDEARRDRDPILAVIRGTAVNNDGADKVGYWAPGVPGQSAVIRMAQQVAGVTPRQISYVEAHGTGTALGDPVEIAALSDAFTQTVAADPRGAGDKGAAGSNSTTAAPAGEPWCAIGSVKSNLGHLEVAAGITALIKLVLSLQRGQIPPSLHVTQPNPQIDFSRTPFYVNTRLRDWPADAQGRRIGAVSSFGIGGTNAHAIVETEQDEALDARAAPAGQCAQLWPWSAATQAGAQELGAALAECVGAGRPAAADVAWTLQHSRERFAWRGFHVVVPGAAAALAHSAPPRQVAGTVAKIDAGAPRVAFLFPGQGSQTPAMLAGLYDACQSFRQQLDHCFTLLRPLLGCDPQTLWRAGGDDGVAQTRYAQPLLFAVSYALARQWQAWGVEPAVLLGHSLGEYVAACLAGVFSVEDALRVLVRRGDVCQDSAAGAMLSVAATAEDVHTLCGDIADVAAHNAPRLSVLSVAMAQVDVVCQRLEQAGLAWRRLPGQYAFHSRLLHDQAERFRAVLRTVTLQAPQRLVISNVSGAPLSAAQATDSEYWVRHLLAPVQFATGLQTLREQPVNVVLEVGPGTVLSQLAHHNGWAMEQCISSGWRATAPDRGAAPAGADVVALFSALGRLWQAGVEPRWQALHGDPPPRRVRLPGYPFARERHWRDAPAAGLAAGQNNGVSQSSSAGTADAVQLHSESWRRLALNTQPALDPAGQFWLVFHDTLGYSADLAYKLRRAGARVGDVYDNRIHPMTGIDAYSVDPQQPADFELLWQRLRADGDVPTGIVFTWGLSESTTERDRPYRALEYLARALTAWRSVLPATAPGSARPRLLLVHNHTAQVLGHEQLCPGKGMLPVAGEVVAAESDLAVCSVDIDLTDEDERQLGGRRRRTVTQLLHILRADWNQADITAPLAVRGYHCWRREFMPLAAFPSAPEQPAYQGWRAQGVYLVTGGASGIGYRFAQYVAARYVAGQALRTTAPEAAASSAATQPPPATLVITGRRRADDETLVHKLAALRATGVAVDYRRCDAGDETAMTALLNALLAQYGQIHGVFHAAGVAGGGLLAQQTPAAMAAVLKPKCYGSQALLQALRGQPVDFVLLSSSLLALGGMPGQFAYAAANRFMDTLAQMGRRYKVPLCAVNWDGWRDIGMLAAAADTAPADNDTARASSSVDNGHGLLGRALGDGVYEQRVDAGLWLLHEHRLFEHAVMPGTAWLELAWAVAAEWWGDGWNDDQREARPPPARISAVEFIAPLVIDGAVTLHTQVQRQSDCQLEVTVSSVRAGHARLHCRFLLEKLSPPTGVDPAQDAEPKPRKDITAEADQGRVDITVPAHLPPLADFDPLALIDYGSMGERWQSLLHCHADEHQIRAAYELAPRWTGDLAAWYLHPALLDLATGMVNSAALLARLASLGQARDGIFLPRRYHSVECHQPLPARFTSVCRPRETGAHHLLLDVDLHGPDGALLVRVRGLYLQRVSAAALRAVLRRAARHDNAAAAPAAADPQTAPAAHDMLAAAGIQAPLSSAHAEDYFDQVLAAATQQQCAQVAVCPGTVSARLAHWRQAWRQWRSERRAAAAQAPAHAAAAAPQNSVEQRVAAVWCEFMGLPQVGRDDNFFELGGHSLMATQIAARLGDEYAVDVPLESLFEHPTVAAISALIQARLWAVGGNIYAAQGGQASSQGQAAAREEGVL